MEVIFLDNGLISRGEHSYSLLQKVSGALAARRIPFRIFGCKVVDAALAAELGAAAHFTRSLYESEAPTPNERRLRSLLGAIRGQPVDPSTPSEKMSWRKLNESFEQDLDALPSDVWKAENLVVVPAISQNQIFGLIRRLLATPPAQRPRTVCQLMFAPNWIPWGRTSRRGGRLYRKAFALAAPLIGRSLFFTAENSAIAKLYLDRYGIGTRILPIPFGGAQPARAAAGRPRIGFFGYSKCDKGFHLLPDAIRFCRTSGVDADFTIQIQHGGWEPAAVAAERDLRALLDVRLIDGVLESEAYRAELNEIDVMLLPYDPVLFGLRGSGIFTESVAAGRPAVASEGTFAAHCMRRGEAAGEVFSPYGARPLAEAIGRIIPGLAARKAEAAVHARAFSATHSADAYVDVLLDLAKAQAPGAAAPPRREKPSMANGAGRDQAS